MADDRTPNHIVAPATLDEAAESLNALVRNWKRMRSDIENGKDAKKYYAYGRHALSCVITQKQKMKKQAAELDKARRVRTKLEPKLVEARLNNTKLAHQLAEARRGYAELHGQYQELGARLADESHALANETGMRTLAEDKLERSETELQSLQKQLADVQHAFTQFVQHAGAELDKARLECKMSEKRVRIAEEQLAELLAGCKRSRR